MCLTYHAEEGSFMTKERCFFINLHCVSLIVDKVKIGKLNYHPSNIDWKSFGEKAETLCKQLGLDYYIKDGLRQEMLKGGADGGGEK